MIPECWGKKYLTLPCCGTCQSREVCGQEWAHRERLKREHAVFRSPKYIERVPASWDNAVRLVEGARE